MKRRWRRGHSWLLPTKGAGKWRREESVRQSLEESTRPPKKDGLRGKRAGGGRRRSTLPAAEGTSLSEV